MRFKTVLLLVSATLTVFLTFEEASCRASSPEANRDEKGRRAVYFANSQTNPLRALNKPSKFRSNDGKPMKIECIKGASLSGELFERVKNLVDRDSELLENKFNLMGYTAEERWNTYMQDDTYLLTVHTSTKLVGLAQFTFEMDPPTDTYGIVFLWDLLVDESMRSRGIGTYLLDTLMELTKHFNMRKIMLSVFKSNTRAINLYQRHGFRVDETILLEAHMWFLSELNSSFCE